jgi:hypothetical protein
MLVRPFVSHVERSGANLIAILIHQIFEAARVAGGCDEAMASGQHSFCDVAAQSASAASYQPDFRRCVHTVSFQSCDLLLIDLLVLRHFSVTP